VSGPAAGRTAGCAPAEGEAPRMAGPLLSLEAITVSFDGFKALDDLTFRIPAGGVRVLIGPNGAGKSTLLDTIIGKVRPAHGRVVYEGRDITRLPEHRIARLGIRRKFQTPGVLEGLSVYDNIAVAARRDQGWLGSLGRALPPDERRRVQETLELVGLQDKAPVRAGQLAHGEKQWLEIGIVVSSDPGLLLLDEPTAGMTQHETAQTAELVRRLGARHTVLVIDHDMAFVELLGAPVSVLHMGRLLKEGTIQTLRHDPEVIAIYLGRAKEAAGRAHA
jgi:urea transport system ATP-binding protein